MNVQLSFPKDAIPATATGIAVLYDLDFLVADARERHQFVQTLLARVPSCPVVVHSFNLSDAEIVALIRRSITVTRWPTEALFARVATALDEAKHIRPAA